MFILLERRPDRETLVPVARKAPPRGEIAAAAHKCVRLQRDSTLQIALSHFDYLLRKDTAFRGYFAILLCGLIFYT